MPVYVDQMNRTVKIAVSPKRIVSLVPSQTELLFDLGLHEEVVGITKFCVHPAEWFRSKARVGGTKTIDVEKIKSLQPDLIIANKEENVRGQIEELEKHFPVWVSDIKNIDEALEMMLSVGQLLNKTAEAGILVENIRKNFARLKPLSSVIRTSYFIWKDPYMAAGSGTFINDILRLAGFANIFVDQNRYPVVTIDDLRRKHCDLLLLSSEPYPFKQKHIDELQSLLPQTKIILVDGEIFSWYGSRLLLAPAYLDNLQKWIAAT